MGRFPPIRSPPHRRITATASSTVCARCWRAGRDSGGGAAWHDDRLQRDPGGQGRAHRADHHKGLPRHTGDPRPPYAGAVRPALDQAARPGRAPAAARGDRETAAGRFDCHSARCGERRRGDRHAAPRGRAERRHLPAAFLRQPGARARGGRCGTRGAARCGDFGQPRDPAGDQGISAHQHDGDQRLCAAGGARLCHVARRATARHSASRHRCS